MTPDDYQKLKQKAESLERQKERSQGKIDQLLQQLQEEFDCKTLDGAKKSLFKLEKEEAQKEKEASKALEAFESKWGDRL